MSCYKFLVKRMNISLNGKGGSSDETEHKGDPLGKTLTALETWGALSRGEKCSLLQLEN